MTSYFWVSRCGCAISTQIAASPRSDVIFRFFCSSSCFSLLFFSIFLVFFTLPYDIHDITEHQFFFCCRRGCSSITVVQNARVTKARPKDKSESTHGFDSAKGRNSIVLHTTSLEADFQILSCLSFQRVFNKKVLLNFVGK